MVSLSSVDQAVVRAAFERVQQPGGNCTAASTSQCLLCPPGADRRGDRACTCSRRCTGCNPIGGSSLSLGLRAGAVGADGAVAAPVTGGTNPEQPLLAICTIMDFAGSRAAQ